MMSALTEERYLTSPPLSFFFASLALILIPLQMKREGEGKESAVREMREGEGGK